MIPAADLAAAMPYLQPLALSAATRRAVSKSTLRSLRDGIVEATGLEPVALERLVRVRPRTLVMIATLTGAFYVLLPQLANVDESIAALGSANWGWLAGVLVASGLTYVAAGIGMMGGVREDLPFVPTVQVALASSFVNRVTPANVGGMALNVRYMQKAGIAPADAVTGVGLNVLAGGIVHLGLLVVFLAWSGRGGGQAFAIPSSSTLLVVIAVVLALVGAVLATRRGRGLARAHVVPPVRQSLSSIRTLATSPVRLSALFGGSLGVTLAYVVGAGVRGRRVRRRRVVRPGRGRLPRRLADRRRRTDTRRARRPGGRAGGRAHGRRHGAGDRRRRRAQLPAAHVLGAGAARLALLPAPRAPQLRLTARRRP